MDNLLDLVEKKKPEVGAKSDLNVEKTISKIYPAYEDLTFRAPIQSEAHGMELLTCVQALVTALGPDIIIQVTRKIEKNPQMLQQAMTYLPLILK